MTAAHRYRRGQFVVSDDRKTIGVIRKITRSTSERWFHIDVDGVDGLVRVSASSVQPIGDAIERLVALETKQASTEVAPYWLVHGKGPTNHKHFSATAAEAEAERLAAMCPGQRFSVFAMTSSFISPVGAVQRCQPTPGAIDPDDETPF